MITITVNWNETKTRRIALGDDGIDYSSRLYSGIKRKAGEENQPITYDPETERVFYNGNQVNRGLITDEPKFKKSEPKTVELDDRLPEDKIKELKYLHNESYSDKPELLIMSALKWKYLIRSCMRGKNIMMCGPSGCGNTMSARSAAQTMKKLKDSEFFYFNLGASQDPRTFLIGNVQFNQEEGTYFSESLFVKAIQTENAVILLDELTRAHPEAANILMTVLDAGQRYIRLDEIGDASRSTVRVADGVSFIATANIGAEYTGTKIMDRAIKDRFTIIEMDTLTADEERGLLAKMFPYLHEKKINAIAEVAEATRIEVKKEDSKISTIVSTRATVEMAELMTDGFTFTEASSIVIAPLFDSDGGTESERAYIMSVIQKYNEIDDIKDIFNINDEPTTAEPGSEPDLTDADSTPVSSNIDDDGLFTMDDVI